MPVNLPVGVERFSHASATNCGVATRLQRERALAEMVGVNRERAVIARELHTSTVMARSSEAARSVSIPLGGVAAVLLGLGLVADIVVFGLYVSATGVNINADNPASQPAAFAHQLVNGAVTPFWMWSLLLGGLAVLAFATVQSLAERVGVAPVRPGRQALGYSALVTYVLLALTSSAVERQAGSSILTRDELVATIPLLFGVIIPMLLGAFNLLAAAWIMTTSWAGWNSRTLPRWLAALGGLTGLALLSGVTGQAGIETLAGPWLIATGIWLMVRPRQKA